MKRVMKRVVLSGICLFLAMGIIAQTAVVNIKDSEAMKEEPVVGYFLPRTVLKIEVEAVKTVRKAGPYAVEARKYFGASVQVLQNEEVWTISKISVRQESEPDAGNQYKVYAPVNSNAALLALTETGILRGINLPASFSLDANEERPCEREGRKVEKPTSSSFISNFVVKDDSEKKPNAAVAFEQINTLRETRFHILSQSNDVLQNGSAVEAYLREIDKREEELLALFIGKERKEIVEKTFTVYPDKEMTNQPVFYFAEKQGFSDSGDPVKITLKRRDTGDKTVFSGRGKTGFVYKMPALVNAEITGNETVFWTGAISVAQLGRLAYLPVGFFDKNNIRALFDTQSGALLQMGK
jgi:hypothetical protein